MNKTFITLLSGVAIGLLLAPAKGSETVKSVSNKLGNLKDRFRDKAEDMFIVKKEITNDVALETMA
jgi:gas vesicle protein